MFDQLLQRLHFFTGFAAFGGVLTVSFLSGIDPLWAVARAVGGALAMLAGFGVTSRLVLLVLGVPPEVRPETRPSSPEANATGEDAAQAARPDAG